MPRSAPFGRATSALSRLFGELNPKGVEPMSIHLTAPVAVAIVGLIGRWLFRRREK
jgi:hypothetical protein